MFLVDTNIFIEILLNQKSKIQCESFLKHNYNSELFLSEFALYSIGIILFRKNLLDDFSKFLEDLQLNEVHVVSLDLSELFQLMKIKEEFSLDFDDAYQYLIAKKYNLNIVSLDKDFDKTDIKRIEP